MNGNCKKCERRRARLSSLKWAGLMPTATPVGSLRKRRASLLRIEVK